MSGVEKRRFLRHNTSILVHVYTEETEQRLQALVNISEGGLAFESERPWPIGSKMRISWPAPLNFSFDFQNLEAKIIWCQPHETNEEGITHYEVGVEFSKPDLEAVDMTNLIEELYRQIGALQAESMTEE